jgi:type II secretory pathway pseudopilin PulG
MSARINKQHQSGFSVIEALVILVVIAIVGGIVLVIALRNQAKVANKEANTTQQQTTAQAPRSKDYTTYTNAALGFSFAYPKDWGVITPTGDGTMPPVIGSTPDLKANKNYPFYQGALTYTIATRANYSITGQKKGATYVPVLKNSTYNNYVWKVISVNPADITDKIGDIYNAPVVTSDAGVQLYDFNYNDSNLNTIRWAFETKAGFVTLSLPAFGPKNDKNPAVADSTAHQSISNAIRKSIQLIY